MDVDYGIGDLESARDGGGREEVHAAREARDDATGEFLAAICRRLLPDVVAAEEAHTERMASAPLTGLDEWARQPDQERTPVCADWPESS